MRKAYIQMHLSILLWGFTGILGKLIQLPEAMLVWYRLLLTCIFLCIYVFYKKSLGKLNRKELLRISGVGFIIMVHWIFFYGAIKASNVSITLSCFSSTALFTAITDAAINRNRINPVELLFAALAIIGIYLIFTFQQFYALGIVMALISALLGAIFTVLNKKMVGNYSPETITFYELGSGFIYLTLLLPIYFHFYPDIKTTPSVRDWLWLFLLSSACTVVPFIMSLKALKKVSAFTLNLSLNLEPVYSIILAIIIFKENKEMNWGFYAGTSIILGSVIMHSVYKVRNTLKIKNASA